MRYRAHNYSRYFVSYDTELPSAESQRVEYEFNNEEDANRCIEKAKEKGYFDISLEVKTTEVFKEK